jgi:hypothetical protein
MAIQKTSPYDWNLPVTDPNLFAGRKDELGLIQQNLIGMTLDNPKYTSIVLHGERRVGKTSLLLRASEFCRSNKILPILLTVQSSFGGNGWEFWHELISSLLIEATKIGISVEGIDDRMSHFGFLKPSSEKEKINKPSINMDDLWFSKMYGQHLRGVVADNPPVYLLEHEIETITGSIKGAEYKGVVLILDEFQELNERMIREQLRVVLQTRWGLIFSGKPEIVARFNDSNEPFFNQVKIIPLRNFASGDEIIECALLPLAEEERNLMNPMTLDHITRLSQGKPNQVRLICDAIYNRYSDGQQPDLNITIETLDDVIDVIAEGLQDKVKIILRLNSVDLEILYNITRYVDWSLRETVELDESFRGEGISVQAMDRREQYYRKKFEYFEKMQLILKNPDKDSYSLEGGDFLNLYIRFLYEIRKYGSLSRKLILGKGPPTPFGEKAEKLVTAITNALGRSPELTQFVVHSYYRDEGDIIETVRKRFNTLSKLINLHDHLEESDRRKSADIIAECFETCRLIREAGVYYVLVVAWIFRSGGATELMHTEPSY